MENNHAPWRSPLSRALHRNRSQPQSRYFQLATIRASGSPANRTVVFRGFFGDRLQIASDSRSQKIEQILLYPQSEICWYFVKTREQFRLSGCMTIVDHRTSDPILQTARQALWQSLSAAARFQFSYPHPGLPRTGAGEAFAEETGERKKAIATFCLLLFDPDRVDHLELRGNPQNRYQYCQGENGSWTVEEINP